MINWLIKLLSPRMPDTTENTRYNPTAPHQEQFKELLLHIKSQFAKNQEIYYKIPKWNFIGRIKQEIKIQAYRECYQECFSAFFNGALFKSLTRRRYE